MSLNAFVTLVTTDSYVPGAIVAIRSVLEQEGTSPANPFETVCLVTPATLSVESVKALRKNFSLVVGVEELRSGSHRELQLLGRQDLASTLTKLQLFRLVQFRKIIFLDADTLCLRPLSHLFNLAAPFSAAPDSGWPDCFNSGMFVATPSADTFEKLVQMSEERGSWDGGDQGLLNDFFPDWNRLSFTYNVTPTAYYTYAPAYRRHGKDMKMVHFIGQHKPWHNSGPSRQVPTTSQDAEGGSSDYQSLINRWFDVYSRYFRVGPKQSDFAFPKLQAVWDKPGHVTPYTPPSIEQLKRTFQGVHANQPKEALPTSGPQVEGHYVSMPLKSGRPDLMSNVVFLAAKPKEPPQQASQQPSAPAAQSQPAQQSQQRAPSPPPASAPPQQQRQQAPQKDQAPPRAASPGHWSPPQVAWNPAVSEPPKDDRPQMSVKFDQQYDNIWDGPRSATQRSFFAAPTYGAIPKVTHQNYDNVTKQSSPDPAKLKPMFPWEHKSATSNDTRDRKQSPTSRVFPDDIRYKSVQPTAVQRVFNQETPQLSSSAPAALSLANLSSHYANAWDNVPAIKHMHSRAPPPASTQPQSRAPAPSSAHARGRTSHSISGQGAGNLPRKPSTEGYDTGGEASSRDGDDEDEESDIDDRDRSKNATGGRYPQKSPRSPPQASKAGVAPPKPSVPTSPATQAASSARSGPPGAPQRNSSFQNMMNLTTGAAGYRSGKISVPRTSSAETVTTLSSSAPTTASLPDPSKVEYRAERVSRVFDTKTDTDHIKREGLEALHRFVRNMEAKGAAVNGGSVKMSPSNSKNGLPSQRQHQRS